jgi:hypothetical protein
MALAGRYDIYPQDRSQGEEAFLRGGCALKRIHTAPLGD